MHRIKPLAHQLALAFGSSLLLASYATNAFAQDAQTQPSSQKQERIEVTGSSIKRTDTETASPVQVITREEIQRTGKSSIAEVIRGISSDNSGTISGAFTGGFAAGAAGVSLRGLGVNATLVLVNGRRTASYGLADDGQRSFVDLNSIPLEIVERVEVLKDGASAIYGSDAIAGVVNVILRKDYVGYGVGGTVGTSFKGDGTAGRFSGTAGVGDLAADKFNFFGTVELSREGRIKQKNRSSYLGTNKLDTLPETFGYYDQRGGGVSPTTQNPIRSTPYGALRVDPTQPYFAASACGPEGANAAGLCYFDNIGYADIQPQVNRFNLYGRGTFALSDSTNAFVEAGYFITDTKTRGTPSPLASTWGDLSNLGVKDTTGQVLTVGQLLPNGQVVALGAPYSQYDRIRYSFADVGGRDTAYKNNNIRLVAGLKGAAFGWDYDTAVGYLETKLDQTNKGLIRYSVLLEGLNNGTYQLNNPGVVSSDFYARLSPELKKTSKNSVTFIDGKATGELAQLPGGPLGAAVGLEARREKNDNPALPYTFEGDIIGLGYSAFTAARNVVAGYAELNAPVAKMLELTGAYRIDRYSDYGTSKTPKVGFKFTPAKEFALRGTYAEAFRAPGPAENGKGSTAGFTSILLVSQGNPDIKPETSKSTTLGLVFDSQHGTTATFDFFRIKRRNEIISADSAIVLGNNPTAGGPAQGFLPGAIPGSRVYYDANGDLAAAFAPFINGNSTTTDGVDINLRHKFDLGSNGKLTANVDWTHVRSFKRILDSGVELEYAGTHGPYALSSAAGTPKNRATFELAWDRGPVSLTGRINYVGPMRAVDNASPDYNIESAEGNTPPRNVTLQDNCGSYFPNGYAAPSGCQIAAFTTFDLSGKYQVAKNFEINGSILNLFNKRAPWDPYTYGGVNYNPTYHQAGAVGTFINLGAKYTF
jgi:iron complex outermembrane recepter protein